MSVSLGTKCNRNADRQTSFEKEVKLTSKKAVLVGFRPICRELGLCTTHAGGCKVLFYKIVSKSWK